MAGLYDGLPDVQSLLASFQPDKDAARRMAALDAGFALLGGQGIGNAGLYAMQGYNDALSRQQQMAMQRMQAAGSALQLQSTMQALRDQADVRQALKDSFSAPVGAPGGAAPSPMDAAMSAAPSLAPTVGNVAAVTRAAGMPTIGAPGGSGNGLYEQLLARADYLDQEARKLGSPAVAQLAFQTREQAQKYAPQYDGTETLMQNGQPVVVQKFKNRPVSAVPGFQPKPDYKLVNTGQAQQFVDPLTNTMGPSFANQMTPGEVASNAVAQGQLSVAQRNANTNSARLGIEQQANRIRMVQADPFGTLGLNTGAGGPMNAPAQSGAPAQPGQPTQAPIGARAAVQANLHGQPFLDALGNDALASQIKAYAEGRQAFPSGMGGNSPAAVQMKMLVTQYDPTFDAVNYNARAKVRADFTQGRDAQSLNALNTVAGHLQDLAQAANNLGNTSIPAVNAVKNYVVDAFGGSGPKVFNMNREAVADEFTRAYRGAGGSEGDIQSWKSSLSTANSPQQFRDVLAKGVHLLQSKIDALKSQYQQGMGTTAAGMTFITPTAQSAFDALGATSGGGKVIDFHALPGR